MLQKTAIPLGVVGRGKGLVLNQILAGRLDDASTVAIDSSSADQNRDLAGQLSAVCGTVITVGWSFLQFQITAARVDGAPLTDRMQEAFQGLLRDESDCSLPLGL